MNSNIKSDWGASILVTILVSYAYLALEWLFFVTKPSALNFLPTSEQLAVLFISPVPLLVASLMLALLVFLPLSGVLQIYRSFNVAGKFLYVAVPAFILSCTLLLLIDNFTYTLFQYGVFIDTGLNRLLYALLFLYLFFRSSRFLLKISSEKGILRRNVKVFSSFAVSMLILTFLFSFIFYDGNESHSIAERSIHNKTGDYKNVLIFSSDGVSSNRMSLFGYGRETTPYLNSIKNELMIYENHFTNSEKTTGSVASLLSGKSPTTTRVIYRPDIFSGIHAYQHLPGMLKNAGYDNADFSVRHYADAYDLNMKNSFRLANDRSLDDQGVPLPAWFISGFASTNYFIDKIYDRIVERLIHIIGLKSMKNPYLMVTQSVPWKRATAGDRDRINKLKSFIVTSKKPFFAHTHLLGTHGTRFFPESQKFSLGQKQNFRWMRNFYDDAVLQYDTYISEIIQFLKDNDLYDNTLLIFNSDHGYRWSVDTQLPLMIRFPNNEHVGVVSFNNQRLDIAPTILDYLGLAQPEWMEGESLLNIEGRRVEPIFSVNAAARDTVNGWSVVPSPKPPFYTLGGLNMIVCDKFYSLSLRNYAYKVKSLKKHSGSCDGEDMPTNKQGFNMLMNHLKDANYDTSSISINKRSSSFRQ